MAQTEEYVEYNRAGKIIKGQERQVIRSKYEEDIFPGNHSSVWGSYWREGNWGFKCCYSFLKNSYCTGESGKLASEVPILPSVSMEKPIPEQPPSPIEEKNQDDEEIIQKEESSESSSDSESSDSNSGEDKRTVTEKKTSREKKSKKKRKQKEKLRLKRKMKSETKLQEALRKEEESQREGELMIKLGDRNRAYHSMYEAKEPTAEEIEAFQIKRSRVEDPMAHFTN